MKTGTALAWIVPVCLTAVACGDEKGSNDSTDSGITGAPAAGTGGQPATDGFVASGGREATGGSPATAGQEATGGQLSTGGAAGGGTGGEAGGDAGDAGGDPADAAASLDAGATTATDGNVPNPTLTNDAGVETDSSTEAVADSGDVEPSAPLVPAQGALLGVFYGAASMSETDAMIGRKPSIHLRYYAWTDDWTRGQTAVDLADNRIPLVNWEPFTASLDDIVAGTYDTMVRERAIGAKNLGRQFFLDWGAEMNGDWSPWSGAQNGQDAGKYVAAYRHIHDIFAAEAATNVVWAWCPNVTDEPRAAWNETMNYYPGDEYVDWTCVDGYNWGTSTGWGRWQSFSDVFADIYPKLAAVGKPILIGEMASTELGGDKAQWIDGIIPGLKNDFSMIKAFVWFDIDKETDWRIASSPQSRDAFVRMAADPYLNP